MKANREFSDFVREQEDARGNRHRFFDFKAFSNFIEEDEESVRGDGELEEGKSEDEENIDQIKPSEIP